MSRRPALFAKTPKQIGDVQLENSITKFTVRRKRRVSIYIALQNCCTLNLYCIKLAQSYCKYITRTINGIYSSFLKLFSVKIMRPKMRTQGCFASNTIYNIFQHSAAMWLYLHISITYRYIE